jgi:hypothetical protein
VPSGIASDDTTKLFFQDLIQCNGLASLYSFENEEHLFQDVDHRFRFCLITLTGPDHSQKKADLFFFARQVEHLADQERHFTLSAEDIALLSPYSGTCPIFRRNRDSRICSEIRSRLPTWAEDQTGDVKGWLPVIRRIIDINLRADLLLYPEENSALQTYQGDVFLQANGKRLLRMFEGKIVSALNHRFADAYTISKGQRTGRSREIPRESLHDPYRYANCRAWIPEDAVLSQIGDWQHRWFFSYMDVCSVTNERTVIPCVIPWSAPTFSLRVLTRVSGSPRRVCCLLANFQSFVFDYFARQFVGGLHLSDYIMVQMAVVPPEIYDRSALSSTLLPCMETWMGWRILELSFTAWDLFPFARDCGYEGPPFRWNDDRRFLLRCELDAAFFHLYGVNRDDTDYIMETFPVVKKKDIQQHGDYRTKLTILEIYDAMQRAIETGEPYQTRLDPPPADPSVAHPPRESV